jgi:succinate dehydrogenase / fumarate reductase cytochrome b subunit
LRAYEPPLKETTNLMATAAPPAEKPPQTKSGVAPLRAGQGHDFLLRRLHSLSGIVPVGAFLFEHILISNATAMKGPYAYYNQVKFLTSIPLVFVLELCFIWLPIAFHGLYGIYIWLKASPNPISYPWLGNWMYTLQRWTGGIAFAYIIWHTWTMRFSGVHLPDYPAASFGKVQMELFHPAIFAFYVVGIVAASWHFAYGIWLFCAKWGILIGEGARKKALVACLAFFALMSSVGILSLTAFTSREQMPIQGPALKDIEQGNIR